MISQFTLNGYTWHIEFVNPNDPMLIDRTKSLRVATTDYSTHTVYLSTDLHGDFFVKVLLHELGHCAIYSFGLDVKIRQVVYPEYWIETEEWLCNYLWNYGFQIFRTLYKTMGSKALDYIPHELERFIA